MPSRTKVPPRYDQRRRTRSRAYGGLDVRLPARAPNSPSAQASRATRTVACDGCHRISFQKCGTYTPPTTGQFNMCNCTAGQALPQEIRHPSPDCDKATHRPSAGTPREHKKDRAGLGGVQRDLRRTLVSARKSWAWALLGQNPRRLELWFGRLDGLGDLSNCPVMQLFRPRCAAAGYPRAVRGPQPRDSGGARRACGWT